VADGGVRGDCAERAGEYEVGASSQRRSEDFDREVAPELNAAGAGILEWLM
jgi:hypothetical protein